MQFTTSFFAAALVAAANAAIFTNTPADFQTVKAGTPFNITWSGASGAVTVLLKNGDPTALKTVETIVAGATATSFVWTPEKTLTDGLYAFEIDDTSGPNYSVQFTLNGGAASSASASGSSTSASSSTGSSSSGSATVTSTSNSTSTTTTGSSSSATGSTTGSSKTTGSKTSTSTGTSTSPTTTPTTSVNSSSGLASPLALVFLALAAIMTLH